MPSQTPYVTTAGPDGRRFATTAVAMQAILVNPGEEVLLLHNSTRSPGWQVVSGAIEAGETLLDGTLREVHEEVGAGIRVRPLGAVHVGTFRYDQNVRHMLATHYLFEYQGGEVQPGDDMLGSAYRWWSLAELDRERPVLHASTERWILRRAVELYRLWRDAPEQPLQPAL
jgi:ADP-ribose pyrophosphatase YjhB (NUDIX family)